MKNYGKQGDWTQGQDPIKRNNNNEFEDYERNKDLFDPWSDGVSSENFPDGTNRPDLQQEIIEKSKKPEEIFKASSHFYAFPDSFLILNDIHLYNVPITGISLSTQTDVFIGETLRSSAPIIDSEGRQDVTLNLSIPFPPGESQVVKLRRLMAEITKHPLVFVHNNAIKQKLGVDEFETTIFILEAGSLRSTMETVGLVVLDLQLHYFNYKPFSKHFYYNAKLPGYTQPSDESQVSTAIVEQIDLDELSGYESSDFVLSKISNQANNEIRDKILNTYAAENHHVPVNLPIQSDAWMYFANHLESMSAPITDDAKDSLGFKFREYKIIMPPDSQFAESPATLQDLIDYKYKDVDELYSPKNWRKLIGQKTLDDTLRTHDSQTEQDKQIEALTKNTGTVDPTRKIRFKNKASGKTISVPLLNEKGEIPTDTIYQLSKLADKRKLTANKSIFLSKELIKLFAKIANHYPGRTITFVSGIRDPGWMRKINPATNKFYTKDPKPNKVRKHVIGDAMDLTIKGVPNEDLFAWAKDNLKRSGKGFYPNSKFVHIDTRPTDAIWIDLSYPNKKSQYIKGDQSYLHNYFTKKYGIEQSTSTEIDDDVDTIHNENDIKSDRRTQQEETASYKGSVFEQVEKQRILKEAKTEAEYKALQAKLNNTSKHDPLAREKWIDKQAADGWHYYYDDQKVRNVFYRDIQLNISSDPEVQNFGNALKNIVCSSISTTFGHRIAPMKLTSQPYYTYQFLGAGNKTGQIVLTFAGKEGKRSANILKELFSKAVNNSNQFTSIIKGSGAIELVNTFFRRGGQNTILALSGIKNVIIVDAADVSAPESVDKHQLIIEFIAQDFASEQFEDKFATTISEKQKIIRALMRHIKIGSNKITSNISVDSNLVQYNPDSAGKTYTTVNGTPEWLGKLLVDTVDICKRLDEEMPPIAWKRSTKGELTWQDVYKKWGADHVMNGRVENIHSDERNIARDYYDASNPYHHENPIDTINISEEKLKETRGDFRYNGGQKTNVTHGKVFRRWTSEMNAIYRRFKTYMNDEENMRRFFPGVLEDTIGFVASNINSCYEDMHMPNLPGTLVALPPEYYVYDDSSEDPLIANMTDSQNMELRLENHVNNTYASVERYIEGSFLGGSYLSKNLPKILEQRASEHKRSEGERNLSYYWNYFQNGGKAWEPIYTRRDDIDTVNNGYSSWEKKVSTEYGADSKSGANFKYLDAITRLSPYIRENRQWDSGVGEKYNANLIESLYGEANKLLAFGPNPLLEPVDAAYAGKALDPAKDRLANNIEARNDLEGTSVPGDSTKGNNRLATTKDGGATFSSTAEEREKDRYDIKDIIPGVSAVDLFGFGARALGAMAFLVPGATAALNAIADITDNAEAIGNTAEAIFSDTRALKYSHFITENAEKEEKKRIAQVASKTALAKKRNDLSMRRAFPTFRIFFIEDDTAQSDFAGGGHLKAFHDFYSYSAIQEIKIHEDREIAASMAVIRMTNIGGLLLRRRFGESDKDVNKYGKDAERQGIFADTDQEHPFEKMILQDGVKVQIRLGYAANPNHLKTRFLGQVVEVALAENGKIIEIHCQGYGAELESVQLGPLEDGPVFYSSQQALSGAIIQDSIANFGRQDRYHRANPASARHSWTGGRGDSLLAGLTPRNILSEWSTRGLESVFNRYQFLNYPQDDNIYAPSPATYASTWDTFWNNACAYRPLKQTPWEIFKEHELRHPGYISMAVPYGHEPRMTMFFGSKMQHYWSRPPSEMEVALSRGAKNEITKLRNNVWNIFTGDGLLEKGLLNDLQKFVSGSPTLGAAFVNDILTSGSRYDTGFALGELFGRYVPFRNYHYFDSYHHILKNEISTSVDGTYNEVEIYYTEEEGSITDDDADDVVEHVEKVHRGGAGVFAVKLDENIPESSIRSYVAEYPSCVTTDMARKYAQGIFATTLRDAYKGELIVIGDENIKPYDVCFINDASINMTGPVEVGAVTHIFNRDTGYVSVIKPDLCVETNDYYTASVFDVAASAMSYTYGDFALGAVIPGYNALKTVSFLALSAGVKFAMWTQDGAPVLATPLTLGGKPFLSNSLGPNHTSLILQYEGKWNQYWDDLSDAWDRFDLSEKIFETSVNTQKGFYELFGADATGGLEEA